MTDLERIERSLDSWKIISDEIEILIGLSPDMASAAVLIAEKSRLDAMMMVAQNKLKELR